MNLLRLLSCAIAMLVALMVTSSAYAQFTVVSSSPADGDVDVGLTPTVSLQFSAPLDTTARFDPEEDFFLSFEFFPEVPLPDIAGLTPDLTTFLTQLDFEPDTRYTFLLTGAKSTSGDMLSRPYIVTFTTGSSLPSGTVSGTVTEGSLGKAVGSALVALFADDPETGLFGSVEGNPTNAVVVDDTGQYTVSYVEAGSYNAVTAADSDQDGLLEIESGDAFGLYDGNNDGFIDAIPVGDGENVTGIDMTLAIPAAVSARQNFPAVQTAAESFQADAALTSMFGDLDPSGLARVWVYQFHSASAELNLALASIGGKLAISAVDTSDQRINLSRPLPTDWLDSDDVATIALENGGSDFLSQWMDVEVFGSASMFEGEFSFGKTSEVRSQSTRMFGLSAPTRVGLAAKSQSSLVTTPTPLWFISYYGYNPVGPGANLFVPIHAETGEVNPLPEFFTAAREYSDAAGTLAGSWASDATLVLVESGFIGVHPSGESNEWSYAYYSPTLTKTGAAAARRFTLREGELVEEVDYPLGALYSTEAIPDTWLDSPGVTATADANSGDFRTRNPDAFVMAKLSKGLIPWDMAQTAWQFDYVSFSSSEQRTVFVNGESGAVVVGTEGQEVPDRLSLDQNYPNPFNPETSIRYEVAVGGGATLVIYDALGRTVRTLVDRSHTPGTYTVTWDGRDDSGRLVSSGIYVYQLSTEQATETRSMILLR